METCELPPGLREFRAGFHFWPTSRWLIPPPPPKQQGKPRGLSLPHVPRPNLPGALDPFYGLCHIVPSKKLDWDSQVQTKEVPRKIRIESALEKKKTAPGTESYDPYRRTRSHRTRRTRRIIRNGRGARRLAMPTSPVREDVSTLFGVVLPRTQGQPAGKPQSGNVGLPEKRRTFGGFKRKTKKKST